MRKLFARKRTVLLAVVAVLGLATAAVAYWTQSGSGTGSAGVGSNASVTVNQTSTVSAMYPGGPAQALSGTFDNPNDSRVVIASVTAEVTGTDKAGCDASDFAIEGASASGIEVAPGTGQGSWSGLTIRMLDKAANQDACKNASVAISYTANAS